MSARTIGDYFIVTRGLSKDAYLLSEKQIFDMLEELLCMADVDDMDLISTFRTEDHNLFLIFKRRKNAE